MGEFQNNFSEGASLGNGKFVLSNDSEVSISTNLEYPTFVERVKKPMRCLG